uniref:Gt2 n=1 Tax=Proteus vulgaris TaxID=585 RepID=A0A385JMV7_PROVU|nr:gt2 [Proteus vulgaris]
MITIVTPAYNAENTINELYDNINLILDEYEINWIIVNDCSTDSTINLLEALAKKNKNISIFNFKYNMGPNYARSYGVEKSKTKYILLLDADDLIFTKNIKLMINFITSNNNFDFYFCPILSIKSRKNFNSNLYRDKEEKLFLIKKPTDFIIYGFPHPSSLIIKKDFFIKNNKKNNLKWGEDILLYLILSKNGIGVRWLYPISCYINEGIGRGSQLNIKYRFKLFESLIKESLIGKKKVNSIIFSIFMIFRFTLSYIYKKIFS